MMLFKRQAPAPIAVVGLGGAGCSAVRHTAREPIPGCRYILCDSDDRSLNAAPPGVLTIRTDRRMHSGWLDGYHRYLLTEKFRSALRKALGSAELVLMATGMGRESCNLGPVVAGVAKEARALVVGVAAPLTPDEAEKRCMSRFTGISKLQAAADNVILIDKQRLMHCEHLVFNFAVLEEAICCTVKTICRLLSAPGRSSVEREKAKAILSMSGGAVPAIGMAVAHPYLTNPALGAAILATTTRWHLLDLRLRSANGVLVNVEGGPDLTLEQVSEAATCVADAVDPGASMVIGMSPPDEKLRGTARLTLLATGIDEFLPRDWVRLMEEQDRRRVL